MFTLLLKAYCPKNINATNIRRISIKCLILFLIIGHLTTDVKKKHPSH